MKIHEKPTVAICDFCGKDLKFLTILQCHQKSCKRIMQKKFELVNSGIINENDGADPLNMDDRIHEIIQNVEIKLESPNEEIQIKKVKVKKPRRCGNCEGCLVEGIN